MINDNAYVKINSEGEFQAQYRKITIDLITGDENPFISVMHWLDNFLRGCKMYNDLSVLVFYNNYDCSSDIKWYVQAESYLGDQMTVWFNQILFYNELVANFKLNYVYVEADNMLKLLLTILIENCQDDFYRNFTDKTIKIDSRNTLLYKL